MFALVYTSQAVAAFDEPAITELALKAAAKNERLGVTGFLNYDAAFETFFQFLEGEKETVEQLMLIIESDPRHRVLSQVPILEHERQAAIARTSRRTDSVPLATGARMFPTWQMKYVSSDNFRSLEIGDLLSSVVSSMKQNFFIDRQALTPAVELVNLLRMRSDGLA
jgi:hypothetical protein